jgi:hypothetical protein
VSLDVPVGQIPQGKAAVKMHTLRRKLAAVSGAERHFGWVIECLEAANREIRAWTDGPFPQQAPPRSRYRRERKRSPFPGRNENARVRLATGEPVQFEHHMPVRTYKKDKRNNKRMYYLADTEYKVIVIGILCGHLETAKY